MNDKAIARKKQIKDKKNFLPLTAATLLLWLSDIFLVIFVNPSSSVVVLIFLSLTFFAVLITTSIILQNTRRGFLISSVIVLFLALKVIGVGNIFNLVLLVGIAVAIEFYKSTKS